MCGLHLFCFHWCFGSNYLLLYQAYRSSMLKAFKKTLDEGLFSFVIGMIQIWKHTFPLENNSFSAAFHFLRHSIICFWKALCFLLLLQFIFSTLYMVIVFCVPSCCAESGIIQVTANASVMFYFFLKVCCVFLKHELAKQSLLLRVESRMYTKIA